MHRIRSIALIAFLALIISCAAIAAPKDAFFFVQLADPQMGFNNQNRDMIPEIEHFTKAVAAINRLKPAFVLMTGDYAHSFRDPKEVREFWSITRTIDPSIPVYLAPGNHDTVQAKAEDVRAFEKIFGKDHFSFSYGGSKFIILDSQLISDVSDKETRDAQFAWFKNELEATKAEKPDHIFVCSHKPWFLTKPDEADAYQNVPLAYRTTYLDLMAKYGVDYSLHGHLHHELDVKYGNISVLVPLPLSLSVAKPPVVGLAIFKVYKDHVEHQSYPIDQIPEKVAM